MRLQFYTDTHVDRQIAVQLRSRGILVVRCEEVGLAEAADVQHLEYSAEKSLILITKDDDFIRLHLQWQTEQKTHGGIFFCPYRDQATIGLIVNECLFYDEVVSTGAGTYEDDFKNQLHYIT